MPRTKWSYQRISLYLTPSPSFCPSGFASAQKYRENGILVQYLKGNVPCMRLRPSKIACFCSEIEIYSLRFRHYLCDVSIKSQFYRLETTAWCTAFDCGVTRPLVYWKKWWWTEKSTGGFFLKKNPDFWYKGPSPLRNYVGRSGALLPVSARRRKL